MARRIGAYEIGELIGRGGMGEIYSAYDQRLRRTVVVKAISRDLVYDPRARRRLLAEARAAASLSHPFVCTVHEVLEHDDQSFIVMEHVEGETLRERVARGPLPASEVCRIGIEAAEALAAAHARGIVHRDVSAANIMVTASGHVKVMDFGLAQVGMFAAPDEASDGPTVRAEPTIGAGTITGTPAYLAPEVVRGRPADARSDLYSLGVVLYQMATGRLPFSGSSIAVVLADVLERTPPPPRSIRPELAPELERIILRLLDKDPGRRQQDAASVAADLRGFEARPPKPSSGGARSIAVLPFKDLAEDPANAHIGIGLADATITELAVIKALLVRPTAAIMRYQQRMIDPLQAARELGVDAIVDASFQRAGSRLRVTVQLLDAVEGRSLWGSKITTSLDDIFEMQDEVSRQIARALEVELTDRDELRLARAARPGGEAYELYLKGRLQLLRETIDSTNAAVEYFEKARAADPAFAPACAGLADAYLRIAFTWDPEGDWYRRAARMVEEALRLDRNLPEGRYVRGRLFWCPDGGFRHSDALVELGAAISARPGLNEAHDWMGIVLFHLAQFDVAAAHFEQALALNPEDGIAASHLGFCRFLQGSFQSALDMATESRRRLPTAWGFYLTALAEIQLDRRTGAEHTLDVAARQFPGDVLFYPLRGLLAALRGDSATALQHVDLTIRNSKAFGHYHHAQYDVACIFAALGRPDDALRWLSDAARNGFPCYAFFERDPLLGSVSSDPRFFSLMRELRDECCRYRELYETLRISSRLPLADIDRKFSVRHTEDARHHRRADGEAL